MANWLTTEELKVNIPEGELDGYRVEKFTVTEKDENFGRLRARISFSSHGRFVPQGTYTRLIHERALLMSDTPDEIRDHFEAIQRAKGHCLVNGLGLGVVVRGMLEKSEVEKVTVIEIASQVVKLVGSHFLKQYGDRLTIHTADALEWKPPRGQRYDIVWHDIWPNINTENLPEMHKLHRKYGRRCDWQGSWNREWCEDLRE
jgi:hypothetical protein